jgi:ADP-heptose:LPS heptosyltransferase
MDKWTPYMYRLLFQLYYFVNVRCFPEKKQKKLLFVKNDAIGDYILFRHHAIALKSYKKYKNYDFYLLTSARTALVAKELDGGFFKEVIVIDPKDFNSYKSELVYFYKLRKYGFSVVVNPSYSPDLFSQIIIKYTSAFTKIGIAGDCSNQTEYDKLTYEKEYTRLVNFQNTQLHEFERNTLFFSSLVNEHFEVSSLLFNTQNITEKINRILICPGAGHAFRIWSTQNFGELINRLSISNSKHEFAVAVTKAEMDLYRQIVSHCHLDLKLFLIESTSSYIHYLASSSLVVCNDSSSVHFAIHAGVNHVCISNGNHFGRFIPYPNSIVKNQVCVFPEEVNAAISQNQAVQKFYGGSTININQISVDSVLKACKYFVA